MVEGPEGLATCRQAVEGSAPGTVTLQLRAINQRNEVTATGEAVVELPRLDG